MVAASECHVDHSKRLARHSKKCPHCQFVGEYEPSSLTVCEQCGEVLAESWALQEAVTDIMEDDSWIHKFRADHPDVAAELAKHAERARRELGDLDRPGSGVRPAGRVTQTCSAPPSTNTSAPVMKLL